MPATLKSRLPMIAASLRPRVSAAVKESAERIADDAQARVPKDTSALADAIHVENVSPGVYSVVAGDDDEVFYGHMIENGTTKLPPRPFLVPAAEAERALAEARVTAVLRGL